MQAVQTISPSAVVTRPAAHAVQAIVPVEDEYLPAGQFVHVVARPSGGLNLPTTQDTHEVWPAVGWEVPPGQSEHAAVPVPSAYWPVGQDVHNAELYTATRTWWQKKQPRKKISKTITKKTLENHTMKT